jgi:hypothetical protein
MPVRHVAAAIVWLFSSGETKVPSYLASCYSDHPDNVVMCVDQGAGRHDMSEAMLRSSAWARR